MKKLFMILLSVVLIGSAGCGADRKEDSQATEKVPTEVAEVETETEAVVADVVETETEATETEAAEPESTETEPMETDEPESTEAVYETAASGEETEPTEEEPKTETASSDSKKSDSKESGKKNQSKKTETSSETQSKQAEKSKEESKPVTKAADYSPDTVVSLAIAKCEAGGMVTTEENLLKNLNAGKITQEEYEEYYPLDGLEDSYYSVFVNVDLNKASCIDGSALKSEEEIAQYIADMLLLESDPVFNIRCVGTTTLSGETFYEFRCYR
jgi:outer membrane biosynthesis protein TonB